MIWRQWSRHVCAAMCHRAVALTVSRGWYARAPQTRAYTAYLTQDPESPGGDFEAWNLIVGLLASQTRASRETDRLKHMCPLGFWTRVSITHTGANHFDLNPGASFPQRPDQHLVDRLSVWIKNA